MPGLPPLLWGRRLQSHTVGWNQHFTVRLQSCSYKSWLLANKICWQRTYTSLMSPSHKCDLTTWQPKRSFHLYIITGLCAFSWQTGLVTFNAFEGKPLVFADSLHICLIYISWLLSCPATDQIIMILIRLVGCVNLTAPTNTCRPETGGLIAISWLLCLQSLTLHESIQLFSEIYFSQVPFNKTMRTTYAPGVIAVVLKSHPSTVRIVFYPICYSMWQKMVILLTKVSK